MRSRVELFEQIRRDQAREGLSKRALAERHQVHRRAVRQALDSPMPPQRKQHKRRRSPKLGEHHAFIDEILVADRSAPRKQRHTAQRIHIRLVEERGAEVSERAVREYVSRRKRELSIGVKAFVPQAYEPASQAQVDWSEFYSVLAGKQEKLYLFHMRSSFSGAAYARAYPRQTQQAFLDAHVHALEWFGGCFDCLRYDNLTAAVKQVLKGKRRIETDRFVALRSHYGFDSSFTTPGIEGAHEKGGVEGEIGRFRRRHLVPVPQADSIDELNATLAKCGTTDLARTITGRRSPVCELHEAETKLFRPLPEERFDVSERLRVRVNDKSLVSVKQSHYSAPVTLVGLMVEARVCATTVELFRDGGSVATHERRHGRHETVAVLDHYLDLLERKPGALTGSLALAQERHSGGWPVCFDELWSLIEDRYDATEAASQMVDVLLLCREHGAKEVELAVRGALAGGAHDGRAVALLARRGTRPEAEPIEVDKRLAVVGAAVGPLTAYDSLIGGAQ